MGRVVPIQRQNFDALVQQFEAGLYDRRSCKVCESEHRDFIDTLLRRGHGGPTISRFMRQHFGWEVGSATVQRHKAEHLERERDTD